MLCSRISSAFICLDSATRQHLTPPDVFLFLALRLSPVFLAASFTVCCWLSTNLSKETKSVLSFGSSLFHWRLHPELSGCKLHMKGKNKIKSQKSILIILKWNKENFSRGCCSFAGLVCQYKSNFKFGLIFFSSNNILFYQQKQIFKNPQAGHTTKGSPYARLIDLFAHSRERQETVPRTAFSTTL